MNIVKRFFAGSAIAALLFSASVMPVAAQEQDSVVGSGTAGNGTFDLNVTSGPTGTNATGTVFATLPTGTVYGDVTCLYVEGNRAQIGAVATSESTAVSPGTGIIFNVADNAETGTADLIRLEFTFGTPFCSTPNLFSPAAVTSGDIVVTDAVLDTTVTGLSTYVDELGLEQGTETALMAALNNVNEQNQCNRLNAFINQVNASQSLTQSQENDLLEYAQLVKSAQGCF